MPNESQQVESLVRDAEHDPVVSSLARLLAIGVLALVGVTWKLWTPQTVFPQVPLVRLACDWPGWCDWICLAALVTSAATLLCVGRWGLPSRLASAGIAISLSGFFILDQHRLQPWAWQFFLLSALLSLADDTTVRQGWIWLTVSIYFWSAVSKFDYNFFQDQGPVLVEGFKHAIGIRQTMNRWTESFDVWSVFVLAVGELSVAVLLSIRRTRLTGVCLAVLMHGALLVALGPLGLKHTWGVLLWNLFFAGQTWLLFRVVSTPRSDEAGSRATQRVGLISCRSNGVATGIILGAVLWPILEPVDGCDHWLAWAVYSARAGQLEILITSDEPPPSSPVDYEQILRTIDGVSGVYYRPNVSAWSLKELSVPIYPQYRFQVAVGKDLKRRFQLENMQVVCWRRNRWNGKPTDERVVDLLAGNNSGPSIWNTQPRWSNRE
ncbi:MAG: hypothetical protein JWP89_4444 [Schlesneria sp.]|nr:hypothetical protein [Schlesneria sp.]